MEKQFYAHTNGPDKENWQPLLHHLTGVAERAAGFTTNHEISQIAYLAGLLHDLGKYSQAYQNRLLNQGPRVDHATAGAQAIKGLWKDSNKNILATLVAFCVSGHHTGLPDYGSISDLPSEPTLHARLNRPLEDYSAYHSEIQLDSIDEITYPKLKPTTKTGQFTFSFLTRMVYSMVVDADFQDTETFMNGYPKPRGGYPDIHSLLSSLENYMEKFSDSPQSAINDLRKGVFASTSVRASENQGFFSLTVPTGGGKTLSSLNFALRHAVEHNLERIIYVVPYTTIIEQNARVIKDALGEQYVLEHHSNFDWDVSHKDQGPDHRSDDADSSVLSRLKLATENWDVPIIITTNVQFFESMFAHKSSKSRKVHNIANSVIIFDEAQNLPVEFLKPSLLAVTELVYNYGATAVFCTATQPQLSRHLPSGVTVQEITPNPKELYNNSRRIELINLGKKTDHEVISLLQEHKQALCIVNTRKHALGLYKMLDTGGQYHLSTLMYPKHRQRVIADIRTALSDCKPCRVISTQLLEAGVDLDFPVGFRALAGLDSIIQAGGRVNRNNLQKLAPLYVFEPVTDFIKKNPGFVQQSSDVTRMVLRKWQGQDPISVDAIGYYYDNLYKLQSDHAFDSKKIVAYFEKKDAKDLEFDFRQASEQFSIIGSDTVSVIVPLEPEAIQLVDQLRWAEFPRSVARNLQSYSVNIYRHEFNQLYDEGRVTIEQDRFPILLNPKVDYDLETGLMIQGVSGGDAIIFDS